MARSMASRGAIWRLRRGKEQPPCEDYIHARQIKKMNRIKEEDESES